MPKFPTLEEFERLQAENKELKNEVVALRNMLKSEVREEVIHEGLVEKRTKISRKTKVSNIDMAQMLANGATTKEIAANLGISIRTVETHMDQLRSVYDCHTRPHMIACMMREKLIT